MANSYLNRTTGTASLNTKMTFSAWVKRSVLSDGVAFFSFSTDSSNELYFRFMANDTLQVFSQKSGSKIIERKTNRVFRDSSAWYHLILQIDTTQSTASDRVKFYVNGSQETSFSAETNPSQNETINYVSSATFTIGKNSTADNLYFDGYMSHVAFVDGQALAPTVFGETDSSSGIWKFKSPSGVTWGTNGFHLKFENSGNLGLDSSGNSNTFTVNGNGRQALDTPSNVSATLNNLDPYTSHMVFSHGNNTVDNGSTASNKSYARSTIGVSSGKWYFEAKNITNANFQTIGITDKESGGLGGELGGSSADYVYRNDDGQKGNNNSFSSYGNSYTTNDIIGCAVDLDNLKIYFSKNGVWQNSGVPTSGSTGTGAAFTITAPSLTSTGFYFFAVGDSTAANSSKWSANFGNGYFGTTAISSAGSNGNGSLFEYDVPSGYYALNTKNINSYG